MNVEKFLSFWSSNNTLIIELLIAVILLSVIYLAFRTFFGGNPADENVGHGLGGLNSDEIQRTLQKIIETGGATKSATAPAMGSGATSVDTAQLDKLKLEAQEKEKTIQTMKDQIQQLTAAQASAVNSAANSKDLEVKLKDLEARLAEYEIISEDIADLSFYKEENSRLQKELTSMKGGGAVSASTPPSASAPPQSASPASAAAPPVAAPAEVAAAPEPTPQQPEASPVEPPPAAAAEVSQADAEALAASVAPAADVGVPSPVDDDLMREFAMAVEEQKAAVKKTAEKPAAAAPAPSDKPTSDNLIGEFENFVKKG